MNYFWIIVILLLIFLLRNKANTIFNSYYFWIAVAIILIISIILLIIQRKFDNETIEMFLLNPTTDNLLLINNKNKALKLLGSTNSEITKQTRHNHNHERLIFYYLILRTSDFSEYPLFFQKDQHQDDLTLHLAHQAAFFGREKVLEIFLKDINKTDDVISSLTKSARDNSKIISLLTEWYNMED